MRGKKYDVSGLPEAQFEPGSSGRVLKNLLGIKNQREMDRVEAVATAITGLMKTFEKEQLAVHTPCRFKDEKRVIQALADVHVEAVIIHPF